MIGDLGAQVGQFKDHLQELLPGGVGQVLLESFAEALHTGYRPYACPGGSNSGGVVMWGAIFCGAAHRAGAGGSRRLSPLVSRLVLMLVWCGLRGCGAAVLLLLAERRVHHHRLVERRDTECRRWREVVRSWERRGGCCCELVLHEGQGCGVGKRVVVVAASHEHGLQAGCICWVDCHAD